MSIEKFSPLSMVEQTSVQIQDQVYVNRSKRRVPWGFFPLPPRRTGAWSACEGIKWLRSGCKIDGIEFAVTNPTIERAKVI